jgi:hypothetical protein
MSKPTMSPDGEWMWSGSEWIPAPPSQGVVRAQAIGKAMVQHRAESVEKTRVVPWIGVGAIFLSLFLPFISVAGIFELTGFEMVMEISDLMSEFTSDGGGDGSIDDGSSEGQTLSMEELAFVIAILLFMISPLFFILSGIVSSIALLSKKSPKLMGSLHLAYALLFVVSGLFSPSALGISIFDFIGIGFYIGAFASILLIIDK